jgi:hypothetical protein
MKARKTTSPNTRAARKMPVRDTERILVTQLEAMLDRYAELEKAYGITTLALKLIHEDAQSLSPDDRETINTLLRIDDKAQDALKRAWAAFSGTPRGRVDPTPMASTTPNPQEPTLPFELF